MTPFPARPGRHFEYSEFIGHGRCKDLTPRQRRDLHDLCQRFLDPLRDRFGPVSIVSGCRSPEHNRAVGGAANSFHMYGRHPGAVAADVLCLRGSSRDWYDFLEARHPGGLGYYPGHVHVDTRAQHARW